MRCWLASLIVASLVIGCGNPAPPTPSPVTVTPDPAPPPGPLKDEIPAEHQNAVLAANRLGIGHLERFEYPRAVEQFRIVRKLAPGWIPGSINLAIGLLNLTGAEAEALKKKGGEVAEFASNFDEALAVLDEVLRRAPKNLYAHYCRGIILEYLQADEKHPDNRARANDDFRAVVESDPSDAYAWYKLASTLYDPKFRDELDPSHMDTVEQLPTKIEYLTKSFERNPYNVSTVHSLHLSLGRKGDTKGQQKLIDRFLRLTPQTLTNHGEIVANFYGDMGPYARAIDPGASSVKPSSSAAPPRFDTTRAIDVKLADGERWTQASDFVGKLAVIGRARDRFGVGVAAFDADGDGKIDLYICGAIVGPKGVRDALLVNKGEGTFEDATARLGLPLDRAGLGVAAADYDADRRVDLFLTGVGDNRLLRNRGKEGFADVTRDSGITGPLAVSLTARWMDLDQDGDLDLYVVNYTGAEHADQALLALHRLDGLENAAYRNDGGAPAGSDGFKASNWIPLANATNENAITQGLSTKFIPWPDTLALGGGKALHTGVALLDVDDDRDIDLVLTREGAVAIAIINDRIGAFHLVELPEIRLEHTNGLLAADLDKDGKIDLVSPGLNGIVAAWRNTSKREDVLVKLQFEPFPCDARKWRSALATDVDLDTWTDLVGLPARSEFGPPEWSRNEGTKLATSPLPVAPDGTKADVGMVLADLVGDALPDLLLIREGEAPRLARNLGNGNRWIALGLGGRWKPPPDQMRTNPEGLGTRISIEGQGLDVEYVHTTPSTGLAQSAAPVVLGLGAAKEITLLHLRWPDGVLQCELNLPTDTMLPVAEYNRKTGSCPVLFTWNGERFVCLGDFLGGGGLGYLVAPGVYGQPDRDEAVAIASDQLRPIEGVFRISISEPMDELAYLDKLTLEVVDRPPGFSATPDERFVPEGPRPTGELIAWSRTVEPVKATDQAGRDVTATLKAWDRQTADGFRRLRGWTGYAEEHSVTLDFGDRLASFGAGDRLVLCLAGWVEYPYSQTNYAAATAGVTLKPPVLERLGSDGKWTVLDPHPGYPAGMPRMMTVDLTGKVAGPRCMLRLRTNMECYYDQTFVAIAEPSTRLKTHTLPVSRASLSYRGYTREVSPDGRLPLLYDYDYVDPAPLARLAGKLTRFGDVAKLLHADDDQFCLVGPGDEVRIEFEAKALPALPEGWTRSYVLRTIGYCKDADPFTATSDFVGPLPWKGMPEFPFKHGETRPLDPAYETYLREYQTRPAATK
jgi:tetratricopeptide (TPR) repeat protein